MNISEQQQLIELANAKMPFGKHQGTLLFKLPERYLIWLNAQEIVKGTLAIQLAQIAEIKLNGLESILAPLVRHH